LQITRGDSVNNITITQSVNQSINQSIKNGTQRASLSETKNRFT